MQAGSLDIRREVLFGERLVRCFADRPRSLWELFSASAEETPDADVLTWEPDGRLSYAELRDQAERLAHSLEILGLAPGDRIAALLGNTPEYIITAVACWRLGAIIVPVDTRLLQAEVRHILVDSGARAAVVAFSLMASMPDMSETPDLVHLIVTEERSEGAQWFEDHLKRSGVPSAAPSHDEDLSAIIYTSGTTGAPKGVMLTHVNMIHSTMHFEHGWGLARGSRSLLAIPGANVTGLVSVILTMFRLGGCVSLMPPFKAAEFLRLIEKRRINHAFLVPAQYKLLMMSPALETCDLSSWKLGTTGGAPMPLAFIHEVMSRIPSLRISEGYGSTELASPATLRRSESTLTHASSVGKAVPCADLVIMREDGTEAATGEAGELWVKGPMVCKGYWRNPQATASGFIDGYWKSGDVASLDTDGFVYLHDRKKDVVNRGGYKIYSAEVEAVIAQHEAVAEVAVIPKPDDVLGERVHAVIYLREGKPLTAEELIAFCTQHLADFKVPEGVTIFDGPLPRNSNGKMLKRDLREMLFPV